MIRIGQGVDVHGFDPSRPLVLGGVRISDEGGLGGHSDADAVLHAVTDALLGALGAGDIGQYFPSSDEQWRGADSSVFVREALRLMAAEHANISNLDVTVIAERPRLGAHRDAMTASLAALLEIDRSRVNVKATTTDHLGFIGRAEGICALAVVLIEIGDTDGSA
ncbi:MAG: 2-C-methyl-D-erythritol 2,4-cyclodiphosphate synthase [Thermoanaerobaculia bacterium]